MLEPPEIPLTNPTASIVALAEPLDQTPFGVVFANNVVAPAHTVVTPVIGLTLGMEKVVTVVDCVVEQPKIVTV